MKRFILGFALALVLASASSASAYTYTRDLTLGSQGADVVALQDMLVAGGYLPASTFVGVTKGYFGALTQAAVAKWQAAVGVTPAAGYFGQRSQAKLASMGGTTTTTTTTSTTLKGGDGDFDNYDVLGNPDSTDVEENQTEEVLALEFDAEDSDLMVERMDVLFAETASSTKPWKVLETLTLTIDGDEVAEIDASDSDSWSEEENDEYSVRFDDIDTVVKEGDTAKVVISVTAQDDLSASELKTWSVEVMNDGIRALNADGIQVYEGNGDDDINAGADERTFTLEVATAGELSLSVDEDDNQARVVTVDEDNDTNDEVIYVGTLESEEGDNNIEEVTVTIATTTGTTNGLSDFIKTVYLFIDGDEVGSETVSDDDGSEAIVFDDLDVDIEEGDELDLEVRVDFDNQDGNYATTTTGVYVDTVKVDFVDAQDDDKPLTETTNGGDVTVSLDSIKVEAGSLTAEYSGDTETKGKYTVKFDVTAPEDDDIFIALSSAATSFDIINAATGATTSATTTSSSLTGATITSSHLKITEGQTKTLTLTVYLDNLGGATDKELQVGLKQVSYKVGSTGATAATYTAGLDEDYRTDSLVLYKTAQNN